MDKEKLKKIANNIMLDFKDEELDELMINFNTFVEQAKVFESIDTDNVEPLSFPYEVYHTWIREDEVENEASKEDILKNASDKLDGQIKVSKVVE